MASKSSNKLFLEKRFDLEQIQPYKRSQRPKNPSTYRIHIRITLPQVTWLKSYALKNLRFQELPKYVKFKQSEKTEQKQKLYIFSNEDKFQWTFGVRQCTVKFMKWSLISIKSCPRSKLFGRSWNWLCYWKSRGPIGWKYWDGKTNAFENGTDKRTNSPDPSA